MKMSRGTPLNNYINFLINKFLIFKQNIELDESNSILDSDIIISNIPANLIKPKLNDKQFLQITKLILDNFLVFKIDNKIDKSQKINSEDSENIYLHFKTYKNSESKIHETETSLTLDTNLNTSNTFYIDSIDYTSSDLVKCFDKPKHTGTGTLLNNVNDGRCTKQTDWRYEYKFKLIFQQKQYIFALYDYLDEDDKFYPFNDIYWHVAGNTDNLDVYKQFINQLNLKISTLLQ